MHWFVEMEDVHRPDAVRRDVSAAAGLGACPAGHSRIEPLTALDAALQAQPCSHCRRYDAPNRCHQPHEAAHLARLN